jgi:hypothetical protein
MAGFPKASASRPNVYQNITAPAAGSIVCSNPFGTGTQQIRVISTLAGWASVDHSTSATIATSANIPGSGMYIPVSVSDGCYLVVTPGQLLTFCSTAGSSGYISITEMA